MQSGSPILSVPTPGIGVSILNFKTPLFAHFGWGSYIRQAIKQQYFPRIRHSYLNEATLTLQKSLRSRGRLPHPPSFQQRLLRHLPLDKNHHRPHGGNAHLPARPRHRRRRDEKGLAHAATTGPALRLGQQRLDHDEWHVLPHAVRLPAEANAGRPHHVQRGLALQQQHGWSGLYATAQRQRAGHGGAVRGHRVPERGIGASSAGINITFVCS